jgi:cyanophycinase
MPSAQGLHYAYPTGELTTGLLALVGGDEFTPGNEDQDRLLVELRGPGSAYVLPTAAARQGPARAVATATQWFSSLGLALQELPVLRRSDANSPANVELAHQAGFFYLTGGDPGLVVDVLRDSLVWQAMVDAWRRGAALAGSSAGAMAFAQWTLIRKTYPGQSQRRYKPALGLVPGVAVAPHFETFGHRWVEPALAEPPTEQVIILGIDERSAAVWDGQRWTARGPGKVTLVTRGHRTAHSSGDRLALPIPH